MKKIRLFFFGVIFLAVLSGLFIARIASGLTPIKGVSHPQAVHQISSPDKFVITGGIAKNVGVVTKIAGEIDGIRIHIPPEPMIAGAVGAALFALDRANRTARAPRLARAWKERRCGRECRVDSFDPIDSRLGREHEVMSPIRRIAALAVVLPGLLASFSVFAEETPQGWEHTLFIYGMGAAIHGTAEIGPVEVAVDVSASDVFDALEFGAMVAYRADNGTWSLTGDAGLKRARPREPRRKVSWV